MYELKLRISCKKYLSLIESELNKYEHQLHLARQSLPLPIGRQMLQAGSGLSLSSSSSSRLPLPIGSVAEPSVVLCAYFVLSV